MCTTTLPRKTLISLDDTPNYHCTTRGVHRDFLCGKDPVSGRCFEHRRCWIANRIKYLASVFGIDIAGYAVMSNPYHIVLQVDQEGAASWRDEEVIERRRGLFAGPAVVN